MTRLFSFSVLVVLCTTLSAREYYISKTGSDNNPGTKEAPYLNIQKAANLAGSGDTVIIDEGTYVGPFRPYRDGCTIKAAPGATVVVTMFKEVNDWTLYKDGIYVSSINKNLDDENQVLYNGSIMNLARWPNKTNYNPFDLQAYKASGTNSSLSHSLIPDLPWENGGVLFFLGKNRWTSWRVPITDAESGKVNFKELSSDWSYAGSHSPTTGGEFFLNNLLEALDAEGEWFIDRSRKKLYFKPPGGGEPAQGKTLVRQYNEAVNLSGLKNVSIEGITFIGGKINLRNSYRCTLQNCEILYGNHTIASNSSASVSQTSIDLNDNSRENTVRYCNIQWGAGNGVILKGTNNRIENNYIGNFNYLGSYAAPVELRGQNQLHYNEIFNGGRDDIRGGGNGSDIGYNNIHHSNLINDDCGGIYICCGSYGFTRIHHNWFHDISSRNNNYVSYKACGVYLDNTTKKVIVDHNMMWNLEWTGVQINWAGEDLLIYNNTIWNMTSANSNAMGRWVNGYDIKNIPVYNTLTNKSELHSTDLKNNCLLSLSASPFENFSEQDFRPKASECAVDGGTLIPGYTEGFVGSAPDVGAYESGLEPWIPGPTWSLGGVVDKDSVQLLNLQQNQIITSSLEFSVYYAAQLDGQLHLALKNGSDEVISEASAQVYAGKGTQKIKLTFDPLPSANTYKLALSYSAEESAPSAVQVELIELENPVLPNEIVIHDTEDRIALFQSRTLDYAVLPTDAYDKSVIWTSNNPDLIQINALTGEMTALLVGEASITATTVNGISNTFVLKVIPKTGESLPWIEDFSLAKDATRDMGATSWTIATQNEGVASVAAVNNNQLAIRNLECIFKSGIIDLYRAESVNLELDITADFKAKDPRLDSLLVYYVVDSVEYLAAKYSDRLKKTTLKVNDIRGEQMYILIRAKTGNTSEIYYVDNIRVSENIGASLHQSTVTSEFSIYPNPVNHRSITLQKRNSQAATLRLFDLQGRLIYTTELLSPSTHIQNLPVTQGIYIVELSQANASTSKRLIVH